MRRCAHQLIQERAPFWTVTSLITGIYYEMNRPCYVNLLAKTVRIKALHIFKSSCLDLTILKVPHLYAISKWLEILDPPHHTPKCQCFFV